MDNKYVAQRHSQAINILYVEDDALDTSFFRQLLECIYSLQLHLDHVAKLSDAKDAIKNNDYDLILADLMLPDSQGMRTLQVLYEIAIDIPIIILTANQDDEVSKQAIQYGAADYLIKNETNSRLLSRAIAYAIDRKQVQIKLEALARTDALTGLLNRHAFEERLRYSMLCVERNQKTIALLFIDLDLFKYINDQHGHQAGDVVLCHVAQRLTDAIRQQDTVARIGGDEFVIVLEDVQSEKVAISIAKKILLSLELPMSFADESFTISASIGVYLYNGNNIATVDDVLSRSDHAMYAAKRSGHGGVICYRPYLSDGQLLDSRPQFDSDLRQALSNNEFFLEYQPQFDVRSSQVVGAEALLRWRHPKDGVIPPANFIQHLESSGQIISVGDWVLSTACAQWVSWIRSGKISANQKISINLSPRQCQQENFLERLQNILDSTGLAPWSLDLELTEGMLLENSENNIQLLSDLRKLGISLSLDDFGTGFSSLCYLTQLPIDRIKVDRSFIDDILYNYSTEAVAAAIISLANNLGLEVVAEGVDEQEKIDLLCEYGCDVFQGYHLSMPMLAQDFVQQLSQTYAH